MTTAHGSDTPEPDGAQPGFFDAALTDTGEIHRGPSFATSTAAGSDAAVGRANGDVVGDGHGGEGQAGVGQAGVGQAGAGQAGAGQAGAGQADGDDDFAEDDGDFAPRPRQRFGALSAVLVVALAIALGFLGGEIVQKNYGTTASASGTANRAANFARGEGAAAFGGNGGGFGQAGANGTGTGTGSGTGTGTGTGTTGTTATPAVIGTVTSIKGTTVVVTNLGGTKVTVHLTGTTAVTVPVKDKALKVGQTVTVVGKTAAKVVTATSIVVH